MANTQKDIMAFLEYYSDKTNVLDGSNKRNPTNAYQNFYPQAQSLSGVDSDVASGITYNYLAFDASGFGSIQASNMGDLSVSMANTAEIYDLTDTAITGDRLVICSLYIQNVGQDAVHAGSAQLISRYIGTIMDASMSDESADWSISSAISKDKAQVPSRRITSDLMGQFIET